MKKIYLKVGEHKIDITEDLKKEVVSISGDDLFDVLSGCGKIETHIQTLEDLIFNMQFIIRDKENDLEGFSRVFIAKPSEHKKGEEYGMICGSWVDRGLI